MGRKKKPLHKHWYEYTNEEVNDILLNQCKAHNCPYLRRYSPISNWLYIGKPLKREVPYYCDYIEISGGHSRDCSADGCTHWKDKNVKKNVYDWHMENGLCDNHKESKYYL